MHMLETTRKKLMNRIVDQSMSPSLSLPSIPSVFGTSEKKAKFHASRILHQNMIGCAGLQRFLTGQDMVHQPEAYTNLPKLLIIVDT